ncbi:hypothetical protein D6810_00720, partial [Candidatus Dojkabacteria bacterium]
PIQINRDINISERELISEVHYYLTQKIGFGDLPYHFIVDSYGNVYKTNKTGPEYKVDVEQIEFNPIIIGYIGNLDKGDFSLKAKKSISSLVLELANEYSINHQKIFSGTIHIKTDQNRKITLAYNQLLLKWEESLKEIKNILRQNYTPRVREYKIEILNLKQLENVDIYPEQVVGFEIELKNNSNYAIYENSLNEIFLTKKESGSSLFFDNETWISNSQIKIMSENQIILPQETARLTFRIRSPLFYGRISETFEIRTFSGQSIRETSISLNLDIKRSNYRIISIPFNRGFSQMNVRSSPSSVASIVGFATPGQRFRVYEDAGNGYIKIKLPNGVEGWIAGWLVDNI